MPKINYHAKLLPNQCYHIYNHAVGRENLFKKPRNYIYFWSKWQQYISPYFANYACCLMPNHFHVLCKTLPITAAIQQRIEAEAETSKKAAAYLREEITITAFYENQFMRLFSTYTKAINKQEKGRYGSLFVAKFKRTLVPTEERFLYYIHYIHHNPIHHGFVKEYLDYKYSSYATYFDPLEDETLSMSVVLNLYDKLPIGQLSPTPTISALDKFIYAHEIFKRNFKY